MKLLEDIARAALAYRSAENDWANKYGSAGQRVMEAARQKLDEARKQLDDLIEQARDGGNLT